MYFANPWGLLGLLALPVVIAIHLYHQRFPPLVVAGTHLWGAETEVRAAGRRRERLPITASLLLELLAALLLTLVLSQPRFGHVGEVTHLVVVLDNSASMMGTPAGEPSFRDAAIAELQQRVESLERRSVVTLILTGRRPVMLAGPAAPWTEAKPILAEWQPRSTRHEFQPAWDLASQLAEGTGRLLFLTNRVPPRTVQTPQQMEVVSVGRKLDNVAITAARWTFDSTTNKGRIFLRIHNLGRRDVAVTVRGRAKEQTVLNRRFSLPAGRPVPLEAEVPGGLRRLTIDVQSPGDGLAIDNSVTLIEPSVRMLSVSLTLPKDGPALHFTQRVLDAIPDLQPAAAESSHLLVGPAGILPPSRRGLWWLGIGPVDPAEQARKEAKDLIGPFLLEKRNPLLEDVVLGGIVWGGVQPIDLDVSPLISAGKHPLLARLNGTQTTAYLMNIDLGRSNLSDSPDWPILLGNLVELRRDNLPGLRRFNYRLNEEIRFRLFEGTDDPSAGSSDDLVLVHGGKTRPLARTPIVEIPPLDDTGVYEIRDGDRAMGQFAVNFFDPEESELTNLAPGIRQPAVEADTATFALDNPYSWLIMLGIMLIMVAVFWDWFVLKPKVTA